MIIIADLNKTKYEHLQFNAAFIKVLQNIYSTQKLFVFMEKQLYSNVCDELGNMENLTYNQIFLSNENSKLYLKLLKIILSNYYLLKILIRFNNRDDSIYFLNMRPVTNFLYKIIRPLFSKSKVYIILHGELVMLKNEFDKNKIHKMSYYVNRMLKSDIPNSKYIVLGESIKQNLLKYTNLNSNDIISMDIPFINKKIDVNQDNVKGTITVSSIGIVNEFKKSFFMFELGMYLKDYINIGKLKLNIIGKVPLKYDKYINNYVEYYGIGNDHIDSQELYDKCKLADYFIFFYSKSDYELIASGAFFDAITYEKPIIAFKNDYFEHYFKIAGDIGYLCNDFKEMKEVIANILDNNLKDEYDNQVENIKKLKKIIDIKNIANNLKNEILK